MSSQQSDRRLPPELERVLMEMDEALRAGREVDVAALAARYPALADEIRRSAPVLRTLNALRPDIDADAGENLERAHPGHGQEEG
ncbi:MAG: hypothetical protein NUV77_11525 [Thermoguttaceae bacterium]|nr:hypothetical protein [Thermoguttaceae bacterium]